jgi:NAD(P)-dependent dehydrogenase (short-subunit alcohol dehydrogenase family)
MFSLKNKTAIITGGASGIGKAMAMLFTQQGAAVHVIDLNTDEELLALNVKFYNTNITNQAEVNDVVTQIGKVDILVNNAGIAHIGTAENTSTEDFEKVFNVNVKGTYNCIHAAIAFMKNSGGVILNVSSIAAHVGIPDRFAYSMSKGAIHAITLSVAKDFLKNNIRCNCISPARVHTPFVDGFIEKNYPDNKAEMFDKLSKSQPIGRMGTPDEIAKLALYLCSDEAAFITGNNYNIDGGFITLNN